MTRGDTQFLFVDLDGTLIKTDLLYEAFVFILFHKPWCLLAMPFWLVRGKSFFKSQIFARYKMSPSNLPLNQQVLKLIYEAKTSGQKVFLATASPAQVAKPVADSLGIFDGLIASSAEVNLKGTKKYREIERICQKESFSYVGDSVKDLAIWKHAAVSYIVSPNLFLRILLWQIKTPKVLLTKARYQNRSLIKVFLKQIRLHQWSKNLLIFVPIIAAHRFWDSEEWLKTLIAFFGFSLVASSVYLINDLSDLDNDRSHPTKKNRPLAHGDFSPILALGLAPLLLVLSWLLSQALPPPFWFWLIAYFVSNLLYTFWFKKIAVIDVVFLSLLYTLRIHAGGSVSLTPISHWLLAFSTFFFFSLAFVKRYTEIVKAEGKTDIRGRGYRTSDQLAIFTFGCSTSFLAILVMVLYLNSSEVAVLYNHPERVWYMMPLLLFWVTRLWLLAHRKELDEDPVVFAMRDPVTWGVMTILFGILLLAI